MPRIFVGSKPITTAIAAASAAGIPLGGAAAQPPEQPSTGTTVSVEGGIVFSNYWQTTFPGSPASLLPGVSSGADKTGSPPNSTDPLQSRKNVGGYGAFSVGRDFNAMLDWRFSAAFYGFGTTSSSGSASQFFSGSFTSFTNTASITETDRFSFQTFDFDVGEKFTQGPIQFRAFAGLRGLHTDELFTTNVGATGTDKIGFETFGTTNTNTLAQGSSEFLGIGPRAGVDFNTTGAWRLFGSVSGAVIEGQRQSQYSTATSVSLGGATTTITGISALGDRFDWVGNLEGVIGVAWQFSPNGQLAVGYKIDQWYNIRDSFSYAGFSNKQDVLTQTPFLKVTLRY
jgi:hypothetical protein